MMNLIKYLLMISESDIVVHAAQREWWQSISNVLSVTMRVGGVGGQRSNDYYFSLYSYMEDSGFCHTCVIPDFDLNLVSLLPVHCHGAPLGILLVDEHRRGYNKANQKDS
jgi:hypothetical protein